MPAPKTPSLAADTIIEPADRPGGPIVIVKRLNPPHGWPIPGGCVDNSERVEAAAVRGALEETALQAEFRGSLGLYSDPARDSRGHTVTAVYFWPGPSASRKRRTMHGGCGYFCRMSCPGSWPSTMPTY